MGYRGKVAEQERARELRAEGKTLLEIATELDVSKSSVSLWVRDVVFTPKPRHRPTFVSPHPFHVAKLAQVEEMNRRGIERIADLGEEAFFAAGIALYAGEGGKTEGAIRFANCDPRMIAYFCAWLRRYFSIDESRLRVRLYLHQGLDLDQALTFWSGVTRIPLSQFGKPYRAVPDPSIRRNKHEHGLVRVDYSCTRTHREVMGLVAALLSSEALPG